MEQQAEHRRRTDWVNTIRVRFGALIGELAKFGVVGLIALVVDVGLFNLLRFAGGEGLLYDKPLTAKVISVVVATTVAYALNRNWTFSHRARTGVGREYTLFIIVNAIAMGIALTVLWISHYGLGLDNPVADNISANVIGLGLGTAFRFWAYRRFVFPAVEPAATDGSGSLAEQTSAAGGPGGRAALPGDGAEAAPPVTAAAGPVSHHRH